MKELQRKTAEQRAIEKLTELNTEEGQETIIRFGDALPLKEPKAVSISGTIDAPARWVEKRKDDIVSADAHVLVDRDHMSITLKTDENSAYSEPDCRGADPFERDAGVWYQHRREHVLL